MIIRCGQQEQICVGSLVNSRRPHIESRQHGKTPDLADHLDGRELSTKPFQGFIHTNASSKILVDGRNLQFSAAGPRLECIGTEGTESG